MIDKSGTRRKSVHKFRTTFDGGHYGYCECGGWNMTEPVSSRAEARKFYTDHLSETGRQM